MGPATWKIGFSKWIHLDQSVLDRHFAQSMLQADIPAVEVGVYGWDRAHFQKGAEKAKEIIAYYRDNGIRVWSFHLPFGTEIDISHPSFHASAGALFADMMEVLAKVSMDKVIIHPSYEPILDEDRPARLAICTESLNKLYRPDLKMAVETLPRTCLCNCAKETLEMLSPLMGKAFVCVDVNHAHKESAPEMLRKVKNHLITLHISDDDGLDEKHWYPGAGIRNWEDILDTLAQVGYSGVFMYEVGPSPEAPELIRDNFDRLLCAYRRQRP